MSIIRDKHGRPYEMSLIDAKRVVARHRRGRRFYSYLFYLLIVIAGLFAIRAYFPAEALKALRQAYSVDQQEHIGE